MLLVNPLYSLIMRAWSIKRHGPCNIAYSYLLNKCVGLKIGFCQPVSSLPLWSHVNEKCTPANLELSKWPTTWVLALIILLHPPTISPPPCSPLDVIYRERSCTTSSFLLHDPLDLAFSSIETLKHHNPERSGARLSSKHLENPIKSAHTHLMKSWHNLHRHRG
jgi:hypothetical protein